MTGAKQPLFSKMTVLMALLASAEAVIFDVEGVVLDTEPLWDRAQAELLDRRGVRYERHEVKALLTGRSASESIAILARHHGIHEDFEKLKQERHILMIQRLERGIRFIPGFQTLIAALHGRWRTALATAMDPDLFVIADRTSAVSGLIDGPVVTLNAIGGQFTRGKPWPDLYLHACGRLGLPPRKCLVIEDAPNGIVAARRAGARCVALTTTHATDLLMSADATVHTLDELTAAASMVNTTPHRGTVR